VSTLLNPKGSEPPSVYWIRRGAIVVIAITVLVALWWLISSLLGGRGGGDTPSADAGSGSAVASAGASGEPDASSAPSSGASSSEKAPITACQDSDIKVSATTDAATYPVGSTPKLTLTIKNTGDVTCKRDVGPKANSLEITSGGYHVWSSDDCNASDKTKVIKLQPDQAAVSTITWPGHLSQKGCPNGQGAAAKAGRYAVIGKNDGVTSDATPFGLTAS